ncbi:MAG: ParB/RepB/Spo0J family partition protein [Pseudomonadota bacterium]
MLEQCEYRKIPDADIVEEPLFMLSWGRDESRLRNSLAAVGQTTPLALLPSDEGPRLVCGVRRRRALRELGVKEFSAVILPSGFGPDQALILALEENLGLRDFNDAEKALAVGSLFRYFSLEQIQRTRARGLGIPPRPEHLERFRKLALLEPPGLDLLAQGRLDPETGGMLMEIAPREREEILLLLQALAPGRNKTRLLATWLLEIAHGDGVSVSEVLAAPEWREILDAPQLGAPLKEEKFRERLRRLRFPVLSGLEKRRAELLNSLNPPANLRLLLPQSFEGLEFKMEMTFHDLEDFRLGLREAGRLAGDDGFRDLLELG